MSDKLSAVLSAIDTLNDSDPNKESLDGRELTRERIYSERMSARLADYYPAASELLQITARAQHVQRWKSPRSDYPAGKAGYYRWRSELGKMHAQVTADVMEDVGYSVVEIEQVKKLLTKQGIKQDAEVQLLEDVICLVFIEHYFLPFAAKHSEDKVIDIVKKTWKKMSSDGQSAALDLDLPSEAQVLIEKALSS